MPPLKWPHWLAAVPWAWLLLTLSAQGAFARSPGVHAAISLGPPPPERVTRIVTLAPSLTQTVLALGAHGRLVGVSRYDTAEAVKRLPRVGGFNDPSVEAVLALRPDLVLAETAPGNRRAVERMAALGAPVLAVPLRTVAQTLGSIRAIGRLLGPEALERAETLVRGIEVTRREVQARNAGRPRLRVLMVYGFEPLVVAGPGSFAHELLGDVGAVNVAGDARGAFAAYPLERAVRKRPELVVDASDSGVGREKTRTLPGLAEARWLRLPSLDLLQPGPNLGRGLLTLESLLREQP